MCLLKKGPQDLPASAFLLQLALVFYVLSGSLLLATEIGFGRAVLQALTETGLLFVFLFGILRLFQRTDRFLQTAAAAFGCGGLMTLLTVPVLFWAQTLRQADQEIGLASLLLLTLLAWSFVVLGNILRLALSCARFTGMALAFSYMIVSYQIMFRLFPVG